MSTKTTFKRVALVAVAALGLGVLSVAPSSATILTQSLTLASATTTGTVNDTNTATLTESFYSDSQVDSVTITGVITSANAANASVKLAVVAATDSATNVSGVGVDVVGQNTASLRLSAQTGAKTISATITAYLVNPTAAGTYTVTFYVQRSNNGVALGSADTSVVTWSTVVAAKDSKPAANSTVTVRAGEASLASGTAEGTDSAVVASASSTRSTADATVWIRQKNAAGTADESVTAVITGNAFIGTAAGARTSVTALTLKNVTAAAGLPIYVYSNGTAGTATLTMSSPSYSFGTKTFKFSGLATKLAIAADPKPLTIGRTTGGYSNAAMFDVEVTDANGNPVSGLSAASFTVTSSNPLAVASASASADASDGLYPINFVTASGATSGAKSTLTITMNDPADTTNVKKLTTTQEVTLGGAVNKVTITTDKASYSPGEQMIITVTAVDTSGNPVADGRSVPTLSSNKVVTGLSTVATTFAGGKADSIARDTAGVVTSTYRAFAPASGGEFTIYADYADAAAVTQRASGTATVADAATDAATDAANEATDAANAATDAALAAADAADAATAAAQDASDAVAALSASVSKLISSLRAQITSLTNLVIKIQKKVRA
jgi:trimeric autotransporter adhesin